MKSESVTIQLKANEQYVSCGVVYDALDVLSLGTLCF